MRIEIKSTGVRDVGTTRQWHALYTRYQYEKRVAQSLSIKDFDVFLPIYGVAHRWRDRTKHLWLPLFPCYVFIRGGMDRQLQLLTTPGLVGVLQSAGRPVIVPQEQVDGVKRVVENSFRVEPYPFLECGDRVRVIAGPLGGVEGILIRKKGISKLIISMEMLGRSAAVEVDISCVEEIGPLPKSMQLYPVSMPS